MITKEQLEANGHMKYLKYGRFNYKISHLKNKYHLTEKQYTDLYNKQKGKCAMCGIKKASFLNTDGKEHNEILYIDHNHKSGKVRGLLCCKCNTMIGVIENNLDKIEKIKKYISI